MIILLRLLDKRRTNLKFKNRSDDGSLLSLPANDVAVKQRQCYGDEITSVIRTCRKRRWNRQEDKRIQQEIDLQVYLHRLIDEEKKRQIEVLNTPSEEPTTHAGAEALSKQASEIERYHTEKKAELDRLFSDIDDRRKRRDVPDYLCGKISFELMRDPVITPSGITYDRRDIDEHLRSKKSFEKIDTLSENEVVRVDALFHAPAYTEPTVVLAR